MTLIGCILAYVALTAGVWAGSAFLLRLRHIWRLLLTLAVPALIAGVQSWSAYLAGTGGRDDDWAPVFFLVAVFTGSFAAIGVLPIWFLLEEKLGWRAR